MTIAAYCEKGHLAGIYHPPTPTRQRINFLYQEQSRPQRFDRFCIQCGSPVFERCPQCNSRFTRDASFCGSCGQALPWTALALRAAKEYTDEVSTLSQDDKVVLTDTFPDLVNDSAKTPLAVSRFSKILAKASPAFGSALLDILKSVITAEVRKHLNL